MKTPEPRERGGGGSEWEEGSREKRREKRGARGENK